MNQTLKKEIKKEAEALSMEELENVCDALFEALKKVKIATNEKAFREINSIWAIYDNVWCEKCGREY